MGHTIRQIRHWECRWQTWVNSPGSTGDHLFMTLKGRLIVVETSELDSLESATESDYCKSRWVIKRVKVTKRRPPLGKVFLTHENDLSPLIGRWLRQIRDLAWSRCLPKFPISANLGVRGIFRFLAGIIVLSPRSSWRRKWKRRAETITYPEKA